MNGGHPPDRPSPAVYAVLVLLVLMSVGPIVLMLLTSMRLKVDIFSDTASLIFMPTLRNYETVLCNVLWYEPAHVDFCNPTFGRALGNSLMISTVSTAITLVLGCMAAYAIVRFRFMGRDTVSLTTLLMHMIAWNESFWASRAAARAARPIRAPIPTIPTHGGGIATT